MEGYANFQILVHAPRLWLDNAGSIYQFKELCLTGLAIRARDLFNNVTTSCTPVFLNFHGIRAKVYSLANDY